MDWRVAAEMIFAGTPSVMRATWPNCCSRLRLMVVQVGGISRSGINDVLSDVIKASNSESVPNAMTVEGIQFSGVGRGRRMSRLTSE